MFWTAAVAAASCPLHRVAPVDAHALATASGVPRNALVRRTSTSTCAAGVRVEVLALDPVYGAAEPPMNACVAAAELAEIDGWSWVVAPSWTDEGGTPTDPPQVLAALPASVECSATVLSVGSTELSVGAGLWLRPADAATLTHAEAIADHARRRLGPVSVSDILWTDGGRFSLPWTHWETEAEVAASLEREQLDTEQRAERAIRARGPGDAYLYFKGADPIRSDVWGTPQTIHALIDAIADWKPVCAALNPPAVASCAVQLGDISWYTSKRPDPLGHRDHYEGTCVDIRLFRTDASRYEAVWNRPDDRPGFARSSGYDARMTGAFIEHLLARTDVDRVLFNDPAVKAATPARGHDDHLHVCFVERDTQ